jgi:AraC family transcriptional regulator, regulatory protein of adaptative response / methylated-DNA-[protein]-cysteine methyltransferase
MGTMSVRIEDNSSVRENDRYWQAVLAHDRTFDGRFVYAVRSTGVYCRPSCPSRRPRRDQVVFYARPESAEQAGFRSCHRCGKETANAVPPETRLVEKAVKAITAADDGSPTLGDLGSRLQISPRRLARGFKRLTGITPREYGEAQRLGRFKSGLRNSANVTEAIYDAGYGSSRAVYERAATQLGMTPGAYRRGGAGMRIAYTIVDSALGRLLVATTARGVCSVCLGDSDAALEKDLLQEYPKAEIERDSNGLAATLEAFKRHLAGRMPRLDLPVDVQATSFQWRVWRELTRIPYGETRSYSDVARAIGKPRAIRAVANACATNRVAVLIPCHRVVAKDGSPGGYRWGMDRKRALLDKEKANSTASLLSEAPARRAGKRRNKP